MREPRADRPGDGGAGISGPLTLEPIGVARTPLTSRVEAPRQPRAGAGTPGRIELIGGRNFEHALADLEGWDYIWVIFWFHLNHGWRPKVLPPRSRTGRKGVLATRSPHRPNPLGLSALRLERIEGLTLHVRDVDLVDGTPVLDVKPYVPYTDAHPGARCGWLDAAANRGGGEAPPDPVAAWRVRFQPLAAAQAAWVEGRTGLPLRERIGATLALGPEPHPYRRIRRATDGLQLAVKEWRVRFGVDGREIEVLDVRSGFRAAQLAQGTGEVFDAHREFLARWPGAAPLPPSSGGAAE